MGFYRSKRDNGPFESPNMLKWAATVVLSALVGAGATLAITPMVQNVNSPLSSNSISSTSSPTGTPVASEVNVNVNSDITQIVKKMEPDVVAVVNYTTTSNAFTQQTQTQPSDIGSGLMFNKDSKYAYIVTNNHVVQGGSKVKIVLMSGKHIAAKVMGTDPYTDLAVIRVPVSTFSNVQPAQFANSNDLQVGEPAIAIGTPMGLNFADTVTSGIVSGDQRLMPVEEPTTQQTLDYQYVIQTDAAINPGNSGGPLLNASGQVIGINSSKIVAQGFQGMGFAIPSNEVENIAMQIMKTGHAIHPALGITGVDLSSIPTGYVPSNLPVDYGVYVQTVVSSNAKKAGLKPGDVIIGLDGQTIQSIADLRTELFKLKPGENVKVVVYQGATKKTLTIQVGSEKTINTTASGHPITPQSNGSTGGFTNPFTGNGTESGSGSGSGSGSPFPFPFSFGN